VFEAKLPNNVILWSCFSGEGCMYNGRGAESVLPLNSNPKMLSLNKIQIANLPSIGDVTRAKTPFGNIQASNTTNSLTSNIYEKADMQDTC
ncbi:8919_t:CDS:2, partial [Funneliformis mosseae]